MTEKKDFDIFIEESIDKALYEIKAKQSNKAIEDFSKEDLLKTIQLYKDTFKEITQAIHHQNQTTNSLMNTLNTFHKELNELLVKYNTIAVNNRNLKKHIHRLTKLQENEQLKSKLFDNLRHYWYSKGFFTNKQFDTALCKLLSNHNPFLRPVTQERLKEINYTFDPFIFEERLLNDYCYVCKDPLDFSHVSVCWKCHNYICHTCKPPTKKRKYYACSKCLTKINKSKNQET